MVGYKSRLRAQYRVRRSASIAIDAFWHFSDDDGWAIASHIALSTLMSLFPFLIFLTALAGFFGSKSLADEGAELLLDTWPERVAGPISAEIHNVLTQTRSGVLTLGVILAIYFSSSGVEAVRIGLNRAYGVKETRPWWLTRLESIAYVLIGALSLLSLAFLIVLGPLIWVTFLRFAPGLAPLEGLVTLLRFCIAAVVLLLALIIAHKWLPFGRRKLGEIAPGVLVTFALSLASGYAFGSYLAAFAGNYVTTYAGLASVMIALAFLYELAAIFIYGGELNSAIMRAKQARHSVPIR